MFWVRALWVSKSDTKNNFAFVNARKHQRYQIKHASNKFTILHSNISGFTDQQVKSLGGIYFFSMLSSKGEFQRNAEIDEAAQNGNLRMQKVPQCLCLNASVVVPHVIIFHYVRVKYYFFVCREVLFFASKSVEWWMWVSYFLIGLNVYVSLWFFIL